MDNSRLRSWRAHRLGLTVQMQGHSPREVLERSGWCRSIGGVNPYLAIFSRSGASRADIDQAVSRRTILELPSARGCTYVLPESDYQVGLTVGRGFRDAEMKVAAKLGVTETEIDGLGEAVLKALESGDQDPAALKTLVGDAYRSLGEEGKKKGISTTLPLALGRLQARGLILRKSLNGRLDSQRYAYTIWRDGPGQMPPIPLEEAQIELARRFFGWIGPATIAQLATLLGISAKAAKTVTEGLPLAPIEPGSDLLARKEDWEAFHSFIPPTEPDIRLIGGMDNLFHLQRGIQLNLDESDLTQCQVGERGVIPLAQVEDFSNNAIVDRGRIIGIWEYDGDRAEIAWYSFGPPSQELKTAVLKTETFIRDQLGDGRTFSLDSPQSRRPKIDALRNMALQIA